MDRNIVLACLKAITYASGRAHVALSHGDTDVYLDELVKIERFVAAAGQCADIRQNRPISSKNCHKFVTINLTEI